jgi:hypothetical protein
VPLTQSDVTEALDAGERPLGRYLRAEPGGRPTNPGPCRAVREHGRDAARDEAPDRDESADRHPSRASCDFGTYAGDPLPRRPDRAGRARALLRPTDPGRQMRRVSRRGSLVVDGGRQRCHPQEIEEFLTGQRHDAEVGRVLKTILFTNIVGSTERAAEVGDRRWRDLLDAHDAAIRRVLERFRGEEIRTTGDGFLPRSTGPRGRSTARMRSPRTHAGSGSRSERGCAPVNARYGATTWLVSPCTPVLGLPPWQALARYSSRTRCAISSPARGSSSPTGAGTR